MRLFIATRLDDPAAERIHAAFAGARSCTGRASWVRPHAFHLTYAFIGEQNEGAAARIANALPAAVSGLGCYDGGLSGGGFFPNDRRPRVGWLAFEAPDPLNAIADSVRRELEASGVAYDRKAFRAHLTLVRIRDRWSARDVAEFRRSAEELGRVAVVIDRVSLFRSDLRPGGASHTEIASASIGGRTVSR
jgi:2'-5' RNA ligase